MGSEHSWNLSSPSSVTASRSTMESAGAERHIRERPDKLGFIRLLRPEKYAYTARVTRLQPFDPGRTPVIFVHGLQDTPVSWVPMVDALRTDPEIQRRYQLWVFSYPSGYPYPYSAALLRHELDGIARKFPNRKPII